MLSERVRLVHALTWLSIAVVHGVWALYFHSHDLSLWSLLPVSLSAINLTCLSLTLLAYAQWTRETSFRTRGFLCIAGLAHCVSASVVFRSVELYENNLSPLSFLFLLQAALPALSAMTDTPLSETPREGPSRNELESQQRALYEQEFAYALHTHRAKR